MQTILGYLTGVDDSKRNFIFNAFKNNKKINYLLPVEDAFRVFKKRRVTSDDDIDKFINERLKKSVSVVDLGNGVVSAFEHKKSVFNNATKEIKNGSVFRSRVTRVETYGAFLMLFNEYNESITTGLLYKKDISENYVLDVREMFRVGDEVYVAVKEIDSDNLRLGLETKSLFGSWIENISLLEPGGKAIGTVHGLRNDEVFIELSPNIIALANLSPDRVLEGSKTPGVKRGDQVEVYLKSIQIDLDSNRRKVKVEIDRMIHSFEDGEVYIRPILVYHKKELTSSEIKANQLEASDVLERKQEMAEVQRERARERYARKNSDSINKDVESCVSSLEQIEKGISCKHCTEEEMDKVYRDFYGKSYDEEGEI